MDPWAVEIKSGEPLDVSIGQGKLLHISQACLGNMKKGSEGIGRLEIVADGNPIAIEGLCKKVRIRPVGSVFDKDIIIVSHGFEDACVCLYGYITDTRLRYDDDDDPKYAGRDAVKLGEAFGRWKAAIKGRSQVELAQAYAQWIAASTAPVEPDYSDDDYIPEDMDSEVYEYDVPPDQRVRSKMPEEMIVRFRNLADEARERRRLAKKEAETAGKQKKSGKKRPNESESNTTSPNNKAKKGKKGGAPRPTTQKSGKKRPNESESNTPSPNNKAKKGKKGGAPRPTTQGEGALSSRKQRGSLK